MPKSSKLMNPDCQNSSKYGSVVEALDKYIRNYKLFSCFIFSYLGYCYLTTLIYSVSCYTWRQTSTEQASAKILSICYLFSPLPFLLGCGEMESQNNVYPRGTEYLGVFAELIECSLLKVHFHKKWRNLHIKREILDK